MSDHYFQFPISALSYGLDIRNRWTHVLSKACLDYGYKASNKAPLEIVLGKINAYLANANVSNFDLKNQAHLALLFGAAQLDVNLTGDIPDHLERAEEAWQHCQPHPFPIVRIRADLWFKTFTPEKYEHPISLREFAVICAIYAGIGSKPYTKLTHRRIRSLASGYAESSKIESEHLHPIKLSSRQIRTTLDALEANGFFAKFTYNRGECFYSNKMSRSKLEECIERLKLRKLQTVACNRSFDQAASRRIKALKIEASAPLRKSA